MRLDPEQAREKFTQKRVARLATVSRSGVPHLVPVTFAVDADAVVIAMDHKPKSTTNLRRLRNIEANPAVCLLADEYTDDDWTRLWWARADGRAAVHSAEARVWAGAIRLLREKYPQYARQPPEGPVIQVDVHAWSGWTAGN